MPGLVDDLNHQHYGWHPTPVGSETFQAIPLVELRLVLSHVLVLIENVWLVSDRALSRPVASI